MESTKFIKLDNSSIKSEHICCAFSDKKCSDSYQAKKDWLSGEFANGYVFRRIDARAKVFIEYGPGEKAWLPISAANFLNINCFWVSGQYKKQGNAKKLLQFAIDDALAQGKSGLVTCVGTKKLHFMSDTKWLLRQGFVECDNTDYGFSLLIKRLNNDGPDPCFHQSVRSGMCENNNGIVVYYSNRCPFAEFHATTSLLETAEKRNLPLKIIKLKTMEEAQNAPSTATIFSLFYKGQFITTDISACMDKRFDKALSKASV